MSGVLLSYNDKKRLIEELNLFNEWAEGDKVSEKALLRFAGLPNNWVIGLPLTGNPRIDAVNVISNLEQHEHLISRPAYLALGVLVEYMLENTLHIEGRIFLAYLIKQYSLISDENYIKDLASKYLALFKLSSDKAIDLGWNAPQPPFTWLGDRESSELERVWQKDAPFLDANFLAKGARVVEGVCKIEQCNDLFPLGTGFLIEPDLVMTNCHVLMNDEEAKEAQIRFGYKIDTAGQLQMGEVYSIKRVIFRSPIDDLDCAVLQIDHPVNKNSIECVRLGTQKVQKGDLVYIIQHPLGLPQKVVLQNNRITYVSEDFRRMQYLTNTLNGSSGSPVCNDRWEVVGLHHSGHADKLTINNIFVMGNEGIPMISILPVIKDLFN